ncbi:MAG: hypothetical protein JWQ98_258 [Chlorobi bacterium]|nr:hypothetical protein [Chlorobiota bacterium]
MRRFSQLALPLIILLGLLAPSPTRSQRLVHFNRVLFLYPDEYYNNAWAQVTALLGKRLPKSALEIVEEIYQRAREERNEPQIIKAINYKVSLNAQLQSDGDSVIATQLRDEIAKSGPAARAILSSELAEFYGNYLISNRWRIGSRTDNPHDRGSDFRTWSPAAIYDTTRALYLESLRPEDELRRIPIVEYDHILTSDSIARNLRPTLFDLLAHRAFDSFHGFDYSWLGRENYRLADVQGFLPAERFATFSEPAPADSAAPAYTALRLMRRLTAAHLGDPSLDALVDLEIERLQFIREITVAPGSQAAWADALAALRRKTSGTPLENDVIYLLAADAYDRHENREALRLANQAMARFPESRGATNAKVLRADILREQLSIATEKTVLPNAPSLAGISFKDIAMVHCRLVDLSDIQSDGRFYLRYLSQGDELFQSLLKRSPKLEWSQPLPDPGDHIIHTTEIRIPPVDRGVYLLLISPDRSFRADSNAIAYSTLTSTRLSLRTFDRIETGTVFDVRDAATGVPMPGVTVNLYKTANRYDRRNLGYQINKSGTTDRDGRFTLPLLPPDAGYDAEVVELRAGDDRLWVDDNITLDERSQTQRDSQVILFTDREIYRPGQTIHFKGILYHQDPAIPDFKAVEGRPMNVELFDQNDRSIAKATLTTNAFGSFDGTFTIPVGGLTGTMEIRCADERHPIRVEEYRRPKFEVTLDPLEGNHRLGETIIARGSARSFAGSAVDGAVVRYTVSRRTSFPYWNRGWQEPMVDATIATGTAHTDASGKFEIPFVARPDSSADRSNLPVFRYVVEANVTDLNGETSSRATTITIGYTSLAITAGLAETFSTRDTAMLQIGTSNLNGKPVAAAGMVIVEKMREPDHLTRRRLLDPPDRFAMTREEFSRDFPNDEYGTPPSDGGEVERIILRRPFRADTTGKDSVALAGLAPGSYRVRVMGRDPSGDTITAGLESTAYDPSSHAMPTRSALFVIEPAQSFQPGDTAVILYGTSYRDVPVTIEVERNGEVIREERTTLSDEVRQFILPVAEKDRGGMAVHIYFVRDYRLYSRDIDIDVPWTNKELRIETASFRDKMSPGAPEEWRFTITGSRADKVAAEMVATLYDASLDAIYPNADWNRFRWPSNERLISIDDHTFSVAEGDLMQKNWNIAYPRQGNRYKDLDLHMFARGGFGGGFRHHREMLNENEVLEENGAVLSGVVNTTGKGSATGQNGFGIRGTYATVSTQSIDSYESGMFDFKRDGREADDRSHGSVAEALSGVGIRKNLNETAFFYPSLTTSEKGEIVIRFTAPEALTRWRMIAFAHTADMKIGTIEKSAVTQKDLMLLTNAPRFLREGDSVTFAVKITNMTKGELKGDVALHLLDAATMRPLDSAWENRMPEQKFTALKEGNAASSWSFVVPVGAGPVVYRVVAKAGSFSDGEEAPIPVLPNRMLVTETLPMNIRAGQTRTFELAKLTGSGTSHTLRNHRLTLEITSNPAWYAVQALPYLMEFPHECAEQTFERYYANSLASHLVNSNPKIRTVFERWKTSDALLSSLEKNQEVKSILLEETPWVMQGRDESERKKRIALLFDLNGMANGLNIAADRLRALQQPDGGWPWFPGMATDRFITQYIATGFGHLRKLGIESEAQGKIKPLMQSAVAFLDRSMARDYQRLRAMKGFDAKKNHLGNSEAQYLYMRSFYPEIQMDGARRESLKFWRAQAMEHWGEMSLMSQGMIALAMSRGGDAGTSAAIIASLRERALHSDDLGTWWKFDEGWWWYQAPVETQSVLIEAFNEITGDRKMVDEMRIWLLKQKQVSDWGTTKATADACYALLGTGPSLLDDDSGVTATIGTTRVDPIGTDGVRPEAGTGYAKRTWNGDEIRPQMGSVTLSNAGTGIGWGALYWQYFEQLDRITPHASPLAIERKLYRVNATDHGAELEPITESSPLRVGDLLRVRIEIRVDRDMEYVHLKDMRGAGLEPVESLSGYRWGNGLDYYMSIRDASMNFFFGALPKGNHVFEYSLRASNAGVYSNGISTIQSMYAPEFASHSQGDIVRIR